MSQVVQRCAEVLALGPNPVLPLQRTGSRRPSGVQDLPATVIALRLEQSRPAALGREARLIDELRRVQPADVYTGLLDLEVWAGYRTDLEGLAVAVQRRLR